MQDPTQTLEKIKFTMELGGVIYPLDLHGEKEREYPLAFYAQMLGLACTIFMEIISNKKLGQGLNPNYKEAIEKLYASVEALNPKEK